MNIILKKTSISASTTDDVNKANNNAKYDFLFYNRHRQRT